MPQISSLALEFWPSLQQFPIHGREPLQSSEAEVGDIRNMCPCGAFDALSDFRRLVQHKQSRSWYVDFCSFLRNCDHQLKFPLFHVRLFPVSRCPKSHPFALNQGLSCSLLRMSTEASCSSQNVAWATPDTCLPPVAIKACQAPEGVCYSNLVAARGNYSNII